MAKKPRITAGELQARLASDETYQRMRAVREEEMRHEQLLWIRAEAPLIRDLCEIGIEVGSAWDLVNSTNTYNAAIPVLARHLSRDYPDRVVEGIARALAIPEARDVWPTLVAEFVRRRDPTGFGVKAGLACALAVAADDSVIGELIKLVDDKNHGDNRVLLLAALERSRHPEARAALERAAREEPLAREAQHILMKRDRAAARANLRRHSRRKN